MTLTVKRNLECWWTVPIVLPTDDDRHRKFECRMKFRVPTGKTMENSPLLKVEETTGNDATDYDKTRQVLVNYLANLIVDWKNIKDEEGNDLPYSEENIGLMVDSIPMFTEQVALAIAEMVRGGLEGPGAKKR